MTLGRQRAARWWVPGVCVIVLGLAESLTSQTPPRPDQLIDKLLELVKEKAPLEAKTGEDELQKLLIQRFNVAREELQQRCEDFKKGLAKLDLVFEAGRHMLQAELEVYSRPEDRIKILERALDLMRWYEARLEEALKRNIGSRADLLRAQYGRLNIEIDLLRTRRAAAMPEPK